MNVDLFKMSCVGLEYLDLCEPDWGIAREGNPETTLALGVSQVLLARDLVENRIGGVAPGVAPKKLGSGEFYGSDQVRIARSGTRDPVKLAAAYL
jgi:hypothetical protein